MRFTLWKIAEQHAGNSAQLSRLLQMHECAVDLPGLHASIFEQQNRAVGVQLPGSSQRGFHQREAAAEKNAVARAGHHGFSSRKLNRPTLLGLGQRTREGFGVVAVSSSRTLIQASCGHRSVKTNPTKFLPEENLQRGDIAVADKTLGTGERDAEAVEQIIRAVTAARTENSARGSFSERFFKRRAAFGGGAGKKIAAREHSFGIELRRVAQSRKFLDALLQPRFLHGAG